MDTKYNFVLYLILHCTQLYFNYNLILVTVNTTVATTLENSKLKPLHMTP